MAEIFHLNCGTMRPYGLFPFSTLPIFNTGALFKKGLAGLHCLLIDTGSGLVLIDTGFGLSDYDQPTPFVKLFNRIIGLENDPRETAIRQIEDLGYSSQDLKHIFLTHLHLDHTGGLPDFKEAQVHVYEPEYRRAVLERGFDSIVYIEEHWAHEPKWHTSRLEGHSWMGLPCTPRIQFNGVEIFFVPTPGHSIGHCMVVTHLPDDRFLVHAGDTYAFHGQIDPALPFKPAYFSLFSPVFNATRVIRSFFIYDEMLRSLKEELKDRITIFCSHDPFEYSLLSGTPLETI